MQRCEKENNEKSLGICLALKRAQIQIKSLEVALDSKVYLLNIFLKKKKIYFY